jgi:hypothetical protein
VSPRQLLRLRETRKSDRWDDQKTPAEIAASEAVSGDSQDFLEYLLSQVRQILGTAKWYDPVPTDLLSLLATIPLQVRCNCQPANVVGDLVRVYGPRVSALYRVDKADPTALATMPVWGVLMSKESPTVCLVQGSGIVEDIWTGLTPGKVYFVGLDGRPTDVPPIGTGVLVQRIGVALDVNALRLQPELTMVRLS